MGKKKIDLPKNILYGSGKGKDRLTYDADEINEKEVKNKGFRQKVHSAEYYAVEKEAKKTWQTLKDLVAMSEKIELQEEFDYAERNRYKV